MGNPDYQLCRASNASYITNNDLVGWSHNTSETIIQKRLKENISNYYLAIPYMRWPWTNETNTQNRNSNWHTRTQPPRPTRKKPVQFWLMVLLSTPHWFFNVKNKLRWHPQPQQRFIFTNVSEAWCEAKHWKRCWTCWTWPGPKIPTTFSRTFSGTFHETLLNLT